MQTHLKHRGVLSTLLTRRMRAPAALIFARSSATYPIHTTGAELCCTCAYSIYVANNPNDNNQRTVFWLHAAQLCGSVSVGVRHGRNIEVKHNNASLGFRRFRQCLIDVSPVGCYSLFWLDDRLQKKPYTPVAETKQQPIHRARDSRLRLRLLLPSRPLNSTRFSRRR